MSSKPPTTYDEIVARTVPEPDSSFRPSPEQQREGLARVEPPRDVALAAKVDEALRGAAGAEHISFEIDGERVILRGAVGDLRTWHRIEAVVRAALDREEIDNRMHVA